MFKLLCLLAFSFAVASATDDKKVKELKDRADEYFQILTKLVYDDLGELQNKLDFEANQAKETENQVIIDCVNKAIEKASSDFQLFFSMSEVTGLSIALDDVSNQLNRIQIDDEALSRLEARLDSIKSGMGEAIEQFNTQVKQACVSLASDVTICMAN